jgi:ATP-dependent DNA helicase RecG
MSIAGEVRNLLAVLVGEMKRAEIQASLSLRHEDYFSEAHLIQALNTGVIEMTIPDKPTSSKQKYRLTNKGKAMHKNL